MGTYKFGFSLTFALFFLEDLCGTVDRWLTE